MAEPVASPVALPEPHSREAEALRHDPYQRRPDEVLEAPRSIRDTLARIGPGMVLAASIVGSGELIATTTLGAQVGYAALWIILFSCIVKPVIQAEMGRYTIATGETGLEAFDRVPGPRLGTSWLVWAWAITVLMTLMQVGGMLGGVSQVMHLVVPQVPIRIWALVFAALTLALLLGGGYDRIERLAMVKVGLFTVLTVMAAVVLLRMPEYFSWRALAGGLTFELPSTGLATAVAVFGITGVGAVELMMYPYWCVEKGYARFTGARDAHDGSWERRARGWVRVMHVDIACSLAIYTIATIAFYVLGAGILHGRGIEPASSDMIPVLSQIYTGTLGGWAVWPFYAGAVATLYGTIFAAIASHSRVYADMCRVMGYFPRDDYAARTRYRRGFLVLLVIVGTTLYLAIEAPVKMVVFGGIAQSLLLPLIGFGTIFLRHRHLPPSVAPGAFTTVSLWICTLLTLAAMLYYAAVTLARA
jgi:Mn2+/Fe2+ NRAMP family transporter